ncbi:MAG: 5-deoxy-glucuronate isomerase [Acidobacteriota bacterium]
MRGAAESSQAPVVYRERITPEAGNLQFLTCGEYELAAGAQTRLAAWPADANAGGETARLWLCRAPAERVHPPFHAEFASVSREESRIRRLKGKNVYLLLDVAEPADRLVAGYTFFEPYARSWPPHNHTDQEEVYIFLQGRGSMEVYESPESLTFVHNVGEGYAVSMAPV